jgi:hypothetical protein
MWNLDLLFLLLLSAAGKTRKNFLYGHCLISSYCSVSLLHESLAVRVVDLDDVEKIC